MSGGAANFLPISQTLACGTETDGQSARPSTTALTGRDSPRFGGDLSPLRVI